MKNTRMLTLTSGALLASVAAICLSSCGGATYSDQVLVSDDPTSLTKIVFFECLGHANEGNLGKIVSAFNEKYAGKYEVELSKVAGTYDALHDAVNTKLTAGEVPALCMGYPDSFSVYMGKEIDDSNIYRLDNFIDDPTFGFTAEEKKDFVPEYLAEGQNYQFEGTWSLPMYKSTEIMYYNECYFAGSNQQNLAKFAANTEFAALNKAVTDKGANPTDESLKALKDWVKSHSGYAYELPTTWEDMIALAKQMVADMKTENLENIEFYPVGYDSDANLLISQFAQRGIPFTVNDEASKADPTKHFVFDNDEAKAFVNTLVQNVKDKLLITKGVLGGSKYTNTYFTNLKSAMSIGSTGGSSYNVSSNFKVGLAPVPYAAGKKAQYIMQGPSICFFNNSNDYVHKGSWLFYKMLAETTNNTKLSLENSYDPIKNSCYETTEYKNFVAKHDSELKYDIPFHTQDLRDNYMTSPVFVGSSTARVEIGNVLQYICNSNFSTDEAFAKAMNSCRAAA